MREVNISQLWNRAWDLFKVNWLLFLGLYVLPVIISSIVNFLISHIGGLITMMMILLWPVLVRAGHLVARQGQASFGEVFRDISLLLKVFVYYLILSILGLIPGILSRVGFHIPVRDSVWAGGILVVVGLIIPFTLYLFGWAGPYAILSGRAGVFSAIGQSFSLTAQNFGTVFLARLSYIGLVILGAIPCGLGLLVVIPMSEVFWPLLYLALTGEEGASHA
jgi:uncharacterized membrane protein